MLLAPGPRRCWPQAPSAAGPSPCALPCINRRCRAGPAAGIYTFELTTAGKTDKVPARFTYVYKKQADGEYKIQVHHSSAMPEPTTPAADAKAPAPTTTTTPTTTTSAPTNATTTTSRNSAAGRIAAPVVAAAAAVAALLVL
jgi:hypothetical protein